MKFSFVIPVLNGAKTITPLLKSIYHQDFKDLAFEVIVVDNGSSDKTVELIKSHFPKALVLNCPRTGRSYARNYGLKKACGEYIIFTDADVTLDQNWIPSIISSLEFFPYDVLSSSIKPVGNPSLLQELRELKASSNTQNTYNALEASTNRLPSLNTATVVIKSKFLKTRQIKFDSSLKRCEDTDLTYQIISHGGWLGINRTAISYVSYGESYGSYFLRSIWIGFYNYLLRLRWFGAKKVPLNWATSLPKSSSSHHLALKMLFLTNSTLQCLGEYLAFLYSVKTSFNPTQKPLWKKKRNISTQNLQHLKSDFKDGKYALHPKFTFIDLIHQGVIIDTTKPRFFCINDNLWSCFRSSFLLREATSHNKEELFEYLKKRNVLVRLAD